MELTNAILVFGGESVLGETINFCILNSAILIQGSYSP